MKTNNIKISYYNWTAVLNMFLLAGIMFLMMYFVIISNMVTSSKYRIGKLNEDLAELIEKNAVLTAQKLATENSSSVLNFALSHDMVEAVHITHIFEGSGVALQK